MCSQPTENEDDEECPICCINFPAFNYYGCCSKPICTECYVHLISSTQELEVPCPYCKCAKNSIKVRPRAFASRPRFTGTHCALIVAFVSAAHAALTCYLSTLQHTCRMTGAPSSCTDGKRAQPLPQQKQRTDS